MRGLITWTLAAAAVAAPAVAAAPCTWSWVNPLPQGNNLTAVAADGERVVAVGEGGAVLVSLDSGASWSLVGSGTTETLHDVTWTGAEFVAVSTWHVLTSPDGETWTSYDPTPLFDAVGVAWKPSGFELRSVGSDGGVVLVAGLSVQLRRDAAGTWSLDRVAAPPSLVALAWGGGTWVGVDQHDGGSTLYSSPDGRSWAVRANGTFNLADVAWNGSRFLAVGTVASGLAAVSVAEVSSDGKKWSGTVLQALGQATLLRAAAWDGAAWVAVGDSGVGATSPDGVAWTSGDTGSGDALVGVARTGMRLVAVGGFGALVTRADDGAWSAARSGTAIWLFGVARGHGRFVAVGQHGAAVTSPDGVAWTSGDTGTDATLLAVAWTGRRFVATGNAGAVVTSDDGLGWASAAPAVTSSLWGLGTNGTVVVAVGAGGTILTSPDGEAWTPAASGTSETLYAVAWGDGRFVAVGGRGTILVSDDGTGWTPVDSGTTQYLYAVARGRAMFVAAGASGTILASPDGLAWAPVAGSTSEAFEDVGFDGSRFTAVSSLGRVVASGNGTTWEDETSPAATWLRGIAVAGDVRVVVGVGGTVLRSACAAGPRVRLRRSSASAP